MKISSHLPSPLCVFFLRKFSPTNKLQKRLLFVRQEDSTIEWKSCHNFSHSPLFPCLARHFFYMKKRRKKLNWFSLIESIFNFLWKKVGAQDSSLPWKWKSVECKILSPHKCICSSACRNEKVSPRMGFCKKTSLVRLS